MTSSSKKKKNRKQDFQKVKLKAGRKLPKGLNVTNTAFKTRKIQIREQIHDNTATVIFDNGKKILSIEELLRNLNHLNATTRQNALNGLRGLFNANKQIISKNLNLILSSVSKLIDDKSSDVRKSAQNVLDLILASATSSQISPVFPMLSAYLNCGMTHIEPAIQRDSLRFLDIVLRHFPELLMESNPKILSNFLQQISRKTNNKSNAGRTLLVNPESRLTGPEWRLQVLKRVQKFIKALLSNSKSKQRKDVCMKNYTWNSNLVNVRIPHPESLLHENFPCNYFTISSLNLKEGKLNIVEDPQELQKFISSLLPLVVETWVEARPEQTVNKNGSVLSNDAPNNSLETLNCLMEIIKSILDCIECFSNIEQRVVLKDFLKKSFEKEFFDYFMVSFPYIATSCNKPSKSDNRNKKPVLKNPLKGIDFKVFGCNLNLLIADIFIKLSPSSNNKEKCWTSIIKYLISLLQHSDYKTVAYDTKLMHDILKTISTNNNFKDVSENLLSIALSCYKNEKISIKKKSFLLELFSASILKSDQQFVNSPALTEWLILLPKELLNLNLSSQVISIMQIMATRQNEAFLYGLQSQKSEIIEFLLNIEANGNETEQMQRAIIELLLYVKHFEICDYRMLTKFIRNEAVLINTRCYCIKILTLRYNRNASNFSETEASLYTSFLLSLVLESSLEVQISEPYLPVPIRVFDIDSNLWSTRERILKEVCISVNEFENLNQAKNVILEYIGNLMINSYNCSLICAWSILKFLKDSDLLDSLINSVKDNFVEFLISTIYSELIHGMDGKSIKIATENKIIPYKIVIVLEKLIEGVEVETQATTICILLSKLLQQWSPSRKYLLIIKDISRHLKLRFGLEFTESIGWNSLAYELKIKLQK